MRRYEPRPEPPETPPWEAAKRVNKQSPYGDVIWQSTQNPQSFLDSVMNSVASSSKGRTSLSVNRRTASEPSRSQMRVETPNRRTRSTHLVAPRSAPAGGSAAPYSVPTSDAVRRRSRRSAPVDISKEVVKSDDQVDLEEVASLIGPVAQSLHKRPLPAGESLDLKGKGRAQPLMNARLHHPSKLPPDNCTPPESASARTYSASRARSAAHRSPPLPDAMEIDEPSIPTKASLIRPTAHEPHPSSQQIIPARSKHVIQPRESNSLPKDFETSTKPPPLRPQLSPIIERYGNSKTQTASSTAPGRGKTLGMKGRPLATAAGKPFKAPLPAMPKRAAPVSPPPPQRRSRVEKEAESAANLSSEFDTSFGVDMDELEEQLKRFDG